MLTKCLLLFNTLRYLKPIQWYWRLYLRTKHYLPFATQVTAPSVAQLSLIPPVPKYTSWSAGQLTFLNERREFDLPIPWQDSQANKLWLYNLHYFDYLNQTDVDTAAALAVMHDWIMHNPVQQRGNGWEPYTLALRLVNWIKFLLRTQPDEATQITASLWLQARFLYQHLEYHLLGNHLFKNGVALIYAGMFLRGTEAEAWLSKGLQLISEQLQEQVLPDGGHFERSPMYHLLILEDTLDCLNVLRSHPGMSTAHALLLQQKAQAMLDFLPAVLHSDGDIAFFNDSACGIAPNPAAVVDYAQALGLQGRGFSASAKQLLHADFGVAVLENSVGRMLLDVGNIGPDYLPGHAHCDTLSYELSLAGQRCIVNSGTYQYAGTQRNRFRATAAHNTVVLDGQEQHEIWSTFRVARRGYVRNARLELTPDSAKISATHTGYQRLRGKLLHSRTVIATAQRWEIQDHITGDGGHVAESYVHLHPAVQILALQERQVQARIGAQHFSITLTDGVGTLSMQAGEFSPEFGITLSNSVLLIRHAGVCPLLFGYSIEVQ